MERMINYSVLLFFPYQPSQVGSWRDGLASQSLNNNYVSLGPPIIYHGYSAYLRTWTIVSNQHCSILICNPCTSSLMMNAQNGLMLKPNEFVLYFMMVLKSLFDAIIPSVLDYELVMCPRSSSSSSQRELILNDYLPSGTVLHWIGSFALWLEPCLDRKMWQIPICQHSIVQCYTNGERKRRRMKKKKM